MCKVHTGPPCTLQKNYTFLLRSGSGPVRPTGFFNPDPVRSGPVVNFRSGRLLSQTSYANSAPPQPHSWKQGEPPKTIKDIWPFITALQEELFELREDNFQLRRAVNDLTLSNAKLAADLEALDQYSRRENICFTNIKVDASHKCEDQVVALCNELGVDINTDDLVAAHPLPGKKSPRFIARFKDRATAQKVFTNRRQTKGIDPAKKKTIFGDDKKGVAVQPNVTPKRAALLAQVKDAAEKHSLDSFWVDTKNCNIMLRTKKAGRPVPIMNTIDLLKFVPEYSANEFILCVNPMNLFSVPNFSPVCTNLPGPTNSPGTINNS